MCVVSWSKNNCKNNRYCTQYQFTIFQMNFGANKQKNILRQTMGNKRRGKTGGTTNSVISNRISNIWRSEIGRIQLFSTERLFCSFLHARRWLNVCAGRNRPDNNRTRWFCDWLLKNVEGNVVKVDLHGSKLVEKNVFARSEDRWRQILYHTSAQS